MDRQSSIAWYGELIKPWFAPPSWVFAPAWAVLYTIIAVSFGYVLVQCFKERLPWRVFLPFALNLVFNFAYSPIQFGLRNNELASVDVLLLLGTLIWALASAWGPLRWVVYANLPYLAWVCFATVLQLTITWLNRSPG